MKFIQSFFLFMLSVIFCSSARAAVLEYSRFQYNDGSIEYRLFAPGLKYGKIFSSGDPLFSGYRFSASSFGVFSGASNIPAVISVIFDGRVYNERELYGKEVKFCGTPSSGFSVCFPQDVTSVIKTNFFSPFYVGVDIEFDEIGRITDFRFSGASFGIEEDAEASPERTQLRIAYGSPLSRVGLRADSEYFDGAFDLALIPVPAAGPLAAAGLALLWGVGRRRARD